MAEKVAWLLQDLNVEEGRHNKLYKIFPPIERGVEYLVVSKVIIPEFPATDSYGSMDVYCKVLGRSYGTVRGDVSHKAYLRRLGYRVIDTTGEETNGD